MGELMGTRADFYIGKGETCEWLGSIAWDGYDIPENILACTNEEVYRDFITAWLQTRNDATFPEDGWPWPWKDSRLTDFAYTFVDGGVKIVTLGRAYTVEEYRKDQDNEPYIPIEQRELYFKDRSGVQNVTFGDRSGLIVF